MLFILQKFPYQIFIFNFISMNVQLCTNQCLFVLRATMEARLKLICRFAVACGVIGHFAKPVYPCVRARRAKSVPLGRARARTGRYAGLAIGH
jgi:hypothetical protein